MLKITLENFEDLSEAEQSNASQNGFGREYANYLRISYSNNLILLKSDAMEPEDATFTRNLNWIQYAISTVYNLGSTELDPLFKKDGKLFIKYKNKEGVEVSSRITFKIMHTVILLASVAEKTDGHGKTHIIIQERDLSDYAIDVCISAIQESEEFDDELASELILCSILKDLTVEEREVAYSIFSDDSTIEKLVELGFLF